MKKAFSLLELTIALVI
ncbi:prepilin-type N-terminal cleavage/methylation domain-containing protein, partial [Campylobacter upsaliensis]|nr:prepilin-type N-terminal cleavage/methylation domain-containing protein [Campylobacter upsaliensis]